MKKKSQKKMNIKESYSIGIDLGGTKLAIGLVDENGGLVEQTKVPVEMNREGNPLKTQERIINLMADLCVDLKKRYPQEFKKFKGVGLASAGPLNVQTGTLINPVNFPGWKIVKIQEKLFKALVKRNFKHPVFFQNDAVASALAEGWCGGAKNLKSYAVVTVGTGIGSGVIFQGRPVHTHGMGSEFGHLIIDYKDLQQDKNLHKHTVEGIASGTGLLKRAKVMGFQGSSVEELVLALKNDSKELQPLFTDMAWALAAICYNLSIGFNLEKILISGGLIKIKDLYFEDMKKIYNNLVEQMNPAFKCKIEIAKTQNHAGVIGAAYLPYMN